MTNFVPILVIIRLDLIIQFFHLDCPIKSGNDWKETKQLVKSLKINNIANSVPMVVIP